MHEVLSIGMGWFIIAISDLSKQRKRSTLSDHVTYVLTLDAFVCCGNCLSPYLLLEQVVS
jgi:hypothetical protein